MNVSLTPHAAALLQQKIATDKSADIVISQALTYLQAVEQQRLAWLQAELRQGEESGDLILYTPELLDQIEEEALAELKAGDREVDSSVWSETAS